MTAYNIVARASLDSDLSADEISQEATRMLGDLADSVGADLVEVTVQEATVL